MKLSLFLLLTLPLLLYAGRSRTEVDNHSLTTEIEIVEAEIKTYEAKITSLQERLNLVKSRERRDKASFDLYTSRMDSIETRRNGERDSLLQSLKDMDRTREEYERKIRNEKSKIRAMKRKGQESLQKLVALVDSLLPFMKTVPDHICAPLEGQISYLKSSIESGDMSITEAVSRYCSLLEGLLRKSCSITITAEASPQGVPAGTGKYLTLGTGYALFLYEEQDRIAFWSADTQKWDLSSDSTSVAALVTLFDVKAGERAPRLVSLPLIGAIKGGDNAE